MTIWIAAAVMWALVLLAAVVAVVRR